jgi:predicted Rossmann-fold nucleotide-binding protein
MNAELLGRGMISPGDELMVTVTDDPQEVVRIFQDCRRRMQLNYVAP